MNLPPPPKPTRCRRSSVDKEGIKAIPENTMSQTKTKKDKSEAQTSQKSRIKRGHTRNMTRVVDILGIETKQQNSKVKPIPKTKKSSEGKTRHARTPSRASVVFGMLEEERKQQKTRKAKSKLHRRSVSTLNYTRKPRPKPRSKVGIKKQESSRTKSLTFKQGDIKSSVPLSYGKAQHLDLLVELKNGAPFLKYGSRGFPHFRHVQLSRDQQKIQWFSASKKLSDCEISFANIYQIRRGQNTTKFEKHKVPEFEKLSFSIMYNKGTGKTESLDLVARTPRIYKLWTAGLEELLNKSEENGVEHLSELQSMPTIMEFRPRPSTAPPPRPEGAPPPLPPDGFRVVGSSGGSKKAAREVKLKMEKLQDKAKKLESQLQSKAKKMRSRTLSVARESHLKNMESILAKVQTECDNVRDMYQLGEFYKANQEIWTAGVDMESLTHMIAHAESIA
mmetsp:Transcript_10425/g.15555  ORF Transcript_10425/g.15555 Transcript_10425/m.15555 type:complete len:448 (+) Transcript_10425:36-1379(+)